MKYYRILNKDHKSLGLDKDYNWVWGNWLIGRVFSEEQLKNDERLNNYLKEQGLIKVDDCPQTEKEYCLFNTKPTFLSLYFPDPNKYVSEEDYFYIDYELDDDSNL